MSEIIKAIEHTKKNIGLCLAIEKNREERKLPPPETNIEIHKTILKCLEEKMEREQGKYKNCDTCKYVDNPFDYTPCIECKAVEMTNWEVKL